MRTTDEPTTRWNLSLPLRIAKKVELRLINPTTGRPHYAARTTLVTALLERWLNEGGSFEELLPTNELDEEEAVG